MSFFSVCRLVLPLAFYAISLSSHAQSSVSGKVTNQSNDNPLIGVNILLKGYSIGTVTEVSGDFRLSIPDQVQDPVLIVSYIGFETREIPVSGRSKINVQLEESRRSMEEVVVTAFGVPRQKKEINYSVQEVKNKDIVESNQDNLVNALQGKLAGVQITNTSGSPGASSHILIRGANSINESTSNQPLFVVDGIPISNTAAFGGSNRALDINPNDIESVTVLKGGAAAALYGLEAGNGAIVITTKSGQSGSARINFSSSFSIDQAFRTSPRQMKYKQGNFGVFDDETTSNWGPLVTPGEETFNNVDNFLQTGFRQKYDLSISGGTEKSSAYLSGNFLDHQGIFPGEELKRYGILLKGSNEFSDQFTVNGSVNFINSSNQIGRASCRERV